MLLPDLNTTAILNCAVIKSLSNCSCIIFLDHSDTVAIIFKLEVLWEYEEFS